ncbi:MAG: glycosyltransferase family 4 protein [Anaerolineae bacterium]|nr:glycosyltransferase family 4 protein [Anaerolineae bacterium]
MNTDLLKSHRHCMVVHNYYPIGEPRVQRQAEALAEAGAHVDVICLRHSGEPAEDYSGKVRVVRLPIQRDKSRGIIGQFFEYLTFFVFAFFKVNKLYFQKRYHVVQVHNLPDFLVFCALIPRVFGATVILDIHDLMPEFYASRFKSGFNSLPVKLVQFQEWVSCRFASKVFTVSEWWRQSLINRGINPDKCFVVMNVANDTVFNAMDAEPRRTDTAFHLIYHGTITHRYGIDVALKAVAKAKKEIPNIQFTIHGRGEYLSELTKLTQELRLDKTVRFSTELMPIEELPLLLLTADVGVAPYRRDVFTDGILPTKLMEYAALGIPAIVARTPAIETYFTDEMVAFFEADNVDELTEHIIQLARNKALRQQLARNMTAFNKKYNWTNQRLNYLNIISPDVLAQTAW